MYSRDENEVKYDTSLRMSQVCECMSGVEILSQHQQTAFSVYKVVCTGVILMHSISLHEVKV